MCALLENECFLLRETVLFVEKIPFKDYLFDSALGILQFQLTVVCIPLYRIHPS